MKSRTKPHNAKVPLVSQIHASLPPLWWITKKGRKKVSFLPSSLSFSKKGSPICPPYHIPDPTPFEDITAEFQLNEISHQAQPASPQECPVILQQPCNFFQLSHHGSWSRMMENLRGMDMITNSYSHLNVCSTKERCMAFQCMWQTS